MLRSLEKNINGIIFWFVIILITLATFPSHLRMLACNSIAGKLETSGPALRCIIEFAFD